MPINDQACEFCGRVWTSDWRLAAHMRTEHGVDLPETQPIERESSGTKPGDERGKLVALIVLLLVTATLLVRPLTGTGDDSTDAMTTATTRGEDVDDPDRTAKPANERDETITTTAAPAEVTWPTTPELHLGGEATASTDPFIEGIPAFAGARLSWHQRFTNPDDPNDVDLLAIWHTEAPLSAVNDFYDDAMPAQNYRDWTYCRTDTIETARGIELFRMWFRPGTPLILSVFSQDFTGTEDVRTTTGITIGIDASGPCDPDDVFTYSEL